MTQTEQKLKEFIAKHESKVVDLSRESAIAYYNANASGKKEKYEKSAELSLALNKIYADKNDFESLKEFKSKSAEIADPLLKRQLDILYNAFLGNQIEEQTLERIVRMESELADLYSTSRAQVDGESMSDNQIDEKLKNSKDSQELEKIWKASKQIGHLVSSKVLELVKLRNEAAQKLGFSNYHEMSLTLNEQSPEEIQNILDELDQTSSAAYDKIKSQIDKTLADQYGISVEDLRPWHYQDRFFQGAPRVLELDLDKFFKGKDVISITKDYYDGLGLPIGNLIANSDLLERPGKYQHAYCMDVDRKGDIRVMASVKDDVRWMSTLLHEYGHAAYDKFIDKDLPWILRTPSHTLTTEAVAMLFGRMTYSPAWLTGAAQVDQSEVKSIAEQSQKYLKFNELIFTRWAQVVYRFEKQMYANPDQDLNKLWWDLVSKYQLLTRPQGWEGADWAAKVHIALYPAYYHNYVLGTLLASQIENHIITRVLEKEFRDESFAGDQRVGQYFKTKIFEPGRRLDWRELALEATENELSPKYFADQIIQGL